MPGSPGGGPIARWELVAAPALLASIVLLRVICGFHWGFDSDEWQHLHVAWAWSQGLLEYRDIFDNHAPLFHMLTAPLVATFGETPRIIFLMRLVMLPFSLMTLAAAAVIGAKVWDTRVGLWTPILLAPIPVFFFRSIEYRADGLWAALCTSAVAVMVAGAAGPGRAFVAGLLLGLALVTSLKSVLLLFALAVAALAMPLAAGGMRRGAPQRVRLRLLPPLLGGLALTPVAFVGYFAHRGAVQALLDDTVWHNILPGLGTWASPWRPLLFLPEFALVLGCAVWLTRRQAMPRRARRVAFLALTAGAFLAALQTLWPLYTTYDLLVFYPLSMPLIAGSMLYSRDLPSTTGPGRGRPLAWRLPVVALLLLGCAALEYAQDNSDTQYETAVITETLRLTDPSDPVLDQKGDTIFRRRPTPYIMERITGDRLELGRLPDRIEEDLIATRTCVAAARIALFPAQPRRFLTENFLPIGHLLVAGRFLPDSGMGGGSFRRVRDRDPCNLRPGFPDRGRPRLSRRRALSWAAGARGGAPHLQPVLQGSASRRGLGQGDRARILPLRYGESVSVIATGAHRMALDRRISLVLGSGGFRGRPRPRMSLAAQGTVHGARAWYEAGRCAIGIVEADCVRPWLRRDPCDDAAAAGDGVEIVAHWSPR